MIDRKPRLSTLLSAGVGLILTFASSSGAVAQTPSPRGSESDAQLPTARPRVVAPPEDDSFDSLQEQLAAAIGRGDMTSAVALAERQHRLFPNEMKATADLGDAYLARGDADRAEPLLRAAITQPSKLYANSVAPVLGAIYANLGQISIGRGAARDAISQLQRAVDYAPTEARPRFLLASAFAIAGETDRSTRESRAAFNIDSSAARASDYLLLVRSLRRGNNLAAAADAADAGSRAFPGDLDLRSERIAVLRAEKKVAAALCDLLYCQLLVSGDDPRAKDFAGQIASIRAETDSSATSADEPSELDLLLSYLDDANSGQFDEALPTIQTIVDANPTDFVERLLLAKALVATGRMGRAESLLTALVTEQPKSLPALADLAALLFSEGRNVAATRIVERARVVDPTSPRLLEVVAAWSERPSGDKQ